MSNYFPISDKDMSKLKSLDDLIKHMQKKENGFGTVQVQDVVAFKRMFQCFKDILKKDLPNFTHQELLKIHHNWQDIYYMYEKINHSSDSLFAALDFELRKKQSIWQKTLKFFKIQ